MFCEFCVPTFSTTDDTDEDTDAFLPCEIGGAFVRLKGGER